MDGSRIFHPIRAREQSPRFVRGTERRVSFRARVRCVDGRRAPSRSVRARAGHRQRILRAGHRRVRHRDRHARGGQGDQTIGRVPSAGAERNRGVAGVGRGRGRARTRGHRGGFHARRASVRRSHAGRVRAPGRQRRGGDGRIGRGCRGCRGEYRGGWRAAKHGGIPMPRVRAAESFAVRRAARHAFSRRVARADEKILATDFQRAELPSLARVSALRPEAGKRSTLQHGQNRGEAHRLRELVLGRGDERFHLRAEPILPSRRGDPRLAVRMPRGRVELGVHHGRTAQRETYFRGKTSANSCGKSPKRWERCREEMVERCAPERRAAHFGSGLGPSSDARPRAHGSNPLRSTIAAAAHEFEARRRRGGEEGEGDEGGGEVDGDGADGSADAAAASLRARLAGRRRRQRRRRWLRDEGIVPDVGEPHRGGAVLRCGGARAHVFAGRTDVAGGGVGASVFAGTGRRRVPGGGKTAERWTRTTRRSRAEYPPRRMRGEKITS